MNKEDKAVNRGTTAQGWLGSWGKNMEALALVLAARHYGQLSRLDAALGALLWEEAGT